MIVNVPDIDLTIILPTKNRDEEEEEAKVTFYVPEKGEGEEEQDHPLFR